MAGDNRSLKKEMTLSMATTEIETLVTLIKRHQEGDISALGAYSYPEALKRLQYLRRRIPHLRVKEPK
jgi:hypothetical protein